MLVARPAATGRPAPGWQPTGESAEEVHDDCSEEQLIYITPKQFCPYPEDWCRFLAEAFEV
jgi:hypothetical protein